MRKEGYEIVKYGEWLETVPSEIANDPLWKLEVCSLGLFAADIGWDDFVILNMHWERYMRREIDISKPSDFEQGSSFASYKIVNSNREDFKHSCSNAAKTRNPGSYRNLPYPIRV